MLCSKQNAREEMRTLHLEHIAQGLTHLNCERHNGRLCQNLLELCKMMQMVPPEEYCDQHCESFKKTGLSTLSSYFRSDAGEKLVLTAEYLNFNVDHARDADGLSEAIICVFSELQSLQLLAQKMTLFSVKLHVAGSSLLETVATLSNREAWAESLHAQADSHSEQVRQFIRNPKDVQLLVDAIAQGYAQHLAQPLPSEDGGSAVEDLGSSFTCDAHRSLFGGAARRSNAFFDAPRSLFGGSTSTTVLMTPSSQFRRSSSAGSQSGRSLFDVKTRVEDAPNVETSSRAPLSSLRSRLEQRQKIGARSSQEVLLPDPPSKRQSSLRLCCPLHAKWVAPLYTEDVLPKPDEWPLNDLAKFLKIT